MEAIASSGKRDVALTTRMGKTVAMLRDAEKVYNHRKEQIVTRIFRVVGVDHPQQVFDW
jgi:ATP sulfurylase